MGITYPYFSRLFSLCNTFSRLIPDLEEISETDKALAENNNVLRIRESLELKSGRTLELNVRLSNVALGEVMSSHFRCDFIQTQLF